jgi:hypothetical protein
MLDSVSALLWPHLVLCAGATTKVSLIVSYVEIKAGIAAMRVETSDCIMSTS